MMTKKTAKATSTKPGGVVAKVKDFGKTVADKAKAAGTRVKAAGTKAAAHVSRNKAAYIAGGLGAAGVAGLAAASRKKQSQGEG